MNLYKLEFGSGGYTMDTYCVADNYNIAEELSRKTIGSSPTLTLTAIQLVVSGVVVQQSQAEKEYIALQEAGVDNWEGFYGALEARE